MYAVYGLDDNRIDWRIMRYKQQVEDQCASHCYLLELITRQKHAVADRGRACTLPGRPGAGSSTPAVAPF